MATQPDSDSAPRTPLSRERVLQAALRLADEIGIDALSMRRLGRELGVEAMSLYNHVANKDDILDGILDLVVAEIALPPDGVGWKMAMRHRAISAHETLLRHPWANTLMGSRANIGPAMMRYVDATLGCLRRAGFSVALSLDAWHALDSHIYGFTLQRLNLPFDTGTNAEVASDFLTTLPRERYPHFAEIVAEISTTGRGDEEVTFGLDLILDGLERIKDGG